MEELRACPFCGGEAEYYDGEIDPGNWCVTYTCKKCCAEGEQCFGRTLDEARAAAIAGWNARPEEDRLRARVNELEDVLRSMLAQFDVYASPFSDQFVNKPLAPDGRDAYVLRTVQWKLRELIVRAHKLLNAALDGTP